MNRFQSTAFLILAIPVLVGVILVAFVPKFLKPYVAFLGCAITASVGAYMFAFCGRAQSEIGLHALVVFGLGALVLPSLLQKSTQ